MIYAVLKRTMDILISAVALALLWPVMAAVWLLVRLDSPGPAIFRQKRVGRSGTLFTMYKFRTMRTDADPYGFSPKDDADPRVTRLGNFLRRTSLDELPQLVNILGGSMSVVGPRPLLPWQYEKWTDFQKRRCEVKPGLTGWAQAHGRASLTHEKKIEMDVWYVDHASLLLDIKIILLTILRVFQRTDTFEVQYGDDESTSKS